MWLLANYKLIGIGIVILATFGAGWYVEGQISDIRLKHALEAQQSALIKQCNDDKAITKGANDALQKNLNTVRARLATQRLQPAACVSLAQPANHSGSGSGYAGNYGISSDFLFTYAAECEQYRQEVITLVDFQKQVWKANGQ